MSVRFVGRAAELKALDAFLTKTDPAISVIYGRRRIGKRLLMLCIRSGKQPALLSRLAQTGRFHAWRGRAFERLCLGHAGRIAGIRGFAGIDFRCGPYFRARSKHEAGLQSDLLFQRADNVLTVCEMKHAIAPVGLGVVSEVERKVALLQRAFPSKTIQRVLVVHGEPSRDLVRAGYFYRIIRSSELV